MCSDTHSFTQVIKILKEEIQKQSKRQKWINICNYGNMKIRKSTNMKIYKYTYRKV